VPSGKSKSISSNTRVYSWLKKFRKNSEKSIDTLSPVQLKDAPSLALARSAAGEPTTGKNKKSGKNRKSVDAFLAFRLEAAFHIQTPSTS
jgi:hypothetical protein